MTEFAAVGDELGHFQALGSRHSAIFVDQKPTLLVSFESLPAIRSRSRDALPLGFGLVRDTGWSLLSLVCDRDTWFRDARVYGYFDRLVDDGFFDEFEHVVFYGAGPCGYAAAAFSVACPGATVIAVQPQATLDPRVAEWDPRFRRHRRLNFTDRYGYAPDMLDAAARALVIYDPRVELDAMHAALFTRPNVSKIRLSDFGATLEQDLINMEVLPRLLAAAGDGTLTDRAVHEMLRARRDYSAYLRNTLSRLEADGRDVLAGLLCRHVIGRIKGPRFRRKLDALTAAGIILPEQRTPAPD